MESKYKELYGNDVLTIDEMIELESYGFDTSDASCMWTAIQDNDYNPISWLPVFRGEDKITIEVLREKFPLTYKEGNAYYCYTLGDLIKKLPYTIKDGDDVSYRLIIEDRCVSYYSHQNDEYIISFNSAIDCDGNNLIDVIYELLKYLKVDKYI